MAKFRVSSLGGSPEPGDEPQQPRSMWPTAVAGVLLLAFLYGAYVWMIKRVVVGPGEVLVLMKKHGSTSLPGDQIIIPRAPDPANQSAYAEWEGKYGDCNGIEEGVYSPGTYFGFSPFDYERYVVPAVVVASDRVGIVVKRFGQPLDEGQVLADPARDQRGPLPDILRPGTYFQYSNPYAYEVKQISPVNVDPGHRGVITILAGARPRNPNQYLVEDGALGVQKQTEPEGFRYINPFEKRVIPI